MAAYNLFAILALAVGTLLFRRELGRASLPSSDAWVLGPAMFVASRVGAHVLFSLETGRTRAGVLAYLDFGAGGMSLFGGLAAASIVVAAWALARRRPLLRLLDALAPAAAFAFAVGRGGCLVAGCCRGFPLPPGWRLPAFLPAAGLFPAPLLHSAVEALIGIAVLRAPAATAGARAGAFLVLYGASRFGLAYVRNDPAVWAGMTTAQLFAIATIAVGAALPQTRRVRRAQLSPS